MINRTLNPLPWERTPSHDSLMESFALCYLARYNQEAIGARTLMALNRAYDPNIVLVRPRVVGGHPAYTIAGWEVGQMTRVTVALEGTTSLPQLWDRIAGSAASQPAQGGGFVYGPFETHAEAIYQELMADSTFRSYFDVPRCNVAFSGYSLGAAVAEVLRVKFAVYWPNHQYRLEKFASPRVGTVGWRISQALHSDPANVYCWGDRIDVLPHTSLTSTGNITTPWQTQVVNYCENFPELRWNLNGNLYEHGQASDFRMAASVMADSLRSLTFANPWTFHDIDYYRYMLCSASDNMDAISRSRFLYLEYNDDNSWGQLFATSAGVPSACKVLAGSPPADFELPVDREIETIQERRIERPVSAPPVIMQRMPAANGEERPRGGWTPRRTRDFRSGNP